VYSIYINVSSLVSVH